MGQVFVRASRRAKAYTRSSFSSRVSLHYYAKGKPLSSSRQKVIARLSEGYGSSSLRRTVAAGQRGYYKKIVKGSRKDRIDLIHKIKTARKLYKPR